MSSNLFCANGCFIPDGKWKLYSAVCDIKKIVQDNSKVEDLGKLFSAVVKMNGFSKNLDFSVDNFRVRKFFVFNDIKTTASSYQN